MVVYLPGRSGGQTEPADEGQGSAAAPGRGPPAGGLSPIPGCPTPSSLHHPRRLGVLRKPTTDQTAR